VTRNQRDKAICVSYEGGCVLTKSLVSLLLAHNKSCAFEGRCVFVWKHLVSCYFCTEFHVWRRSFSIACTKGSGVDIFVLFCHCILFSWSPLLVLAEMFLIAPQYKEYKDLQHILASGQTKSGSRSLAASGLSSFGGVAWCEHTTRFLL